MEHGRVPSSDRIVEVDQSGNLARPAVIRSVRGRVPGRSTRWRSGTIVEIGFRGGLPETRTALDLGLTGRRRPRNWFRTGGPGAADLDWEGQRAWRRAVRQPIEQVGQAQQAGISRSPTRAGSPRQTCSARPQRSGPHRFCSVARTSGWPGARGSGQARWNQPAAPLSPALWEQDLVLPTGWMKSYPGSGCGNRASGPPLAVAPRASRPAAGAGGHLSVLPPPGPPAPARPADLSEHRRLPPLLAPRGPLVERMERAIVAAADLTVCTSRFRTDELQGEHPEMAGKIRHLPHGAPSASIPAEPQYLPGPGPADIAHLPRPWVGYIGRSKIGSTGRSWTRLPKRTQRPR